MCCSVNDVLVTATMTQVGGVEAGDVSPVSIQTQSRNKHFLQFSFTQRTQRKRLRLNGNRAVDMLLDHDLLLAAVNC